MSDNPKIRMVELDHKALLRAGASSVLALDPSCVGGYVALHAEEAPNTLNVKSGADKGVAIVNVMGPLAQRGLDGLCAYVDGYDRVAARVVSALQSDEVGAIVLRIDSPGGDVAGLEQAVSSMREAREASGKPVYVYVDELCASAAYWIASGVGTAIYAPPSGRIGSIGCIAALVDESRALENQGLKVTLVRSPAGKAEGHPAGPISDLALERAEALVSLTARSFAASVAARRGLKSEDVLALNGAVLSAVEAHEKGLIDGVASLSQVLAIAAGDLSQGNTMSDQEKAELESARKVMAVAAQVTGKTTAEEITGALHAISLAAARCAELEAGIKAEQEARATSTKTALIAQLRKDQKLMATQIEWAESLSLEALTSFASVAVPFGPPRIEDAAATDPDTVAEAALAAELARFNLTIDDYRAAQASSGALFSNGEV